MKYIIIVLVSFLSLALCAQTAKEATALHIKGRELNSAGNFLEGREYTKQAMEMRKQLFGEVNVDYITSLNNYASTFTMEEKYDEAIALQSRVLELCAQLETSHPNLAMYTINQGRNYYLQGNYTEAANYWEQALPMVEKFGKEYEMLLEWLSLIYYEQNNTAQIERIMRLVEEHNQHELTKECNEPECMLKRAEYYAYTGDNVKAKEHFLKIFTMQMTDKMRIKANLSYGKYLTNIQEFVTSADYYAAAASILKQTGDVGDDYANYSYMAGIRYYIGKEYEHSLPYFQQALDHYKTKDSPMARSNEAKCWEGLGNVYAAMKDYATAKVYYAKRMVYYETYDQANKDYPKSIERLASAEKFNGDYDDAITHYKQALKMYEEYNMTVEYADAANGLKLCYAYAKRKADVVYDEEKINKARHQKLDTLINETLANLDMIRTYLGKLNYAQTLGTAAGFYLQKDDYANSIDYFKQYIPTIREAIADEFRMQSVAERMTLWNDELENIKAIRELLVTLPLGNDALMNELTALMYDAELLSKGILLNSSIEFEKVLLAKGDKHLAETHNTIKRNEKEIKRLRTNAATEEELQELLALMQQNQELQLQLYKGCAEFADFTDYIYYTWKDVQKAMAVTDIAIEFVAIKYDLLPQDNYMIALVLTKEMAYPIAIPICNLLQAASMVDMENVFEIDNLIWGTFSKLLEGKKRIFFAADGSFNQVGIEYLQYNGIPLSEQYEVYRLSSTKEICKTHTASKATNVALFGDINYNDEANYTAEARQAIDHLRGSGSVDGYANLDNTKKEINEISKLLIENKIKNVVLFTDTIASKDAFLKLTDTKVNILHVATHGAYVANKTANESESMNSCVLVFAGANLTESSLATAAEVASMNLRYCDLAVLSACETGLGKLGTDGVFGLQRGFKNAGVHTLLMSLKKVYDASTAELMICFYSNLMAGQSKREALVNAQKEIRQRGYKESKYWASFILLDAL